MTGCKPENAGRNQDGTFLPGASGNPAGKPKGTRSHLAKALDDLAQADAAAVLQKVLGLAKNGDISAARLVLDRTWPMPKGRPVRVPLPPLNNINDLTRGIAAVANAVSDGLLSTEEAQNLVAFIDIVRKTHETVDLERRLSKIEEHLNNEPKR